MYSHKTWRCPYFRYDEKRSVHCEGGTVIRFPDRRSIQDYTTAFCAAYNYGECTVAKALNNYYERKEKEKT
jgi:hypothetical protein